MKTIRLHFSPYSSGAFLCDTKVGNYCVSQRVDGACWYSDFNGHQFKECSTKEECIAACQEHFDLRVKACLEVEAEPAAQLVVKFKEGRTLERGSEIRPLYGRRWAYGHHEFYADDVVEITAEITPPTN